MQVVQAADSLDRFLAGPHTALLDADSNLCTRAARSMVSYRLSAGYVKASRDFFFAIVGMNATCPWHPDLSRAASRDIRMQWRRD